MILWAFSLSKGVMNICENTIATIEFPCEIKKKLKIKVSMGNLDVKFINGNLIRLDKTNLNVQGPHKIIASNKKEYFSSFAL